MIRWWITALWVIAATAGRAPAQTAPPVTPPPPPNFEASEEVDLESDRQRVEMRIGQLESTEAPSETDEAELTAWQKALGFLNQTQNFREQAQRYERQIDVATARLAEIEAQLSAPMLPPSIDAPPDATLDWFSDGLNDVQDRAAAVRDRRAELAKAAVERLERAGQIDLEIATARERLGQISRALNTPSAEDTPASVTAAQRAALRYERVANEAHITALEFEQRTISDLRGLYRAQRQLVERQIIEVEEELTLWTEQIARTRRSDVNRAANEARAAGRLAQAEHPAVQEVTEEVTRLAEAAARVAQQLDETNTEFDVIDRQMTGLESHFNSARQRVETLGRAGRLGQVLRDLRRKLPGLKEHRRSIAQREGVITTMQVNRLDAEQKLFELVNIDAVINELVTRHAASGGGGLPSVDEILGGTVGADDTYLREVLRDRLTRKRDQHLAILIDQYDRCLERLLLLQSRERELVTSVEEFITFIDERVLWVRSTEPVHRADFDQIFTAFRWLFDPVQLRSDFDLLRASVDARPLPTIFAVLALLILVLIQPLSRLRLRAISPDLEPAGEETAWHLVAAAVHTLILSSAMPAAVGYVGWRLITATSELNASPDPTVRDSAVHAAAIGAGLLSVAAKLFMLELVRHICRRGGLAHSFFHWPLYSVRTIRRNVTWVLLVLLPLSFIVVALHTAGNDAYENSLGRLAFTGSMLALAVFLLRIFRPRRGVLGSYFAEHRAGWAGRLSWLLFTVAVATPLLLATLAAFGYFYTAVRLDERLYRSTWFIWWLLIAYSFLLRLLYLTHEEAQSRRVVIGPEPLPEPGDTPPTTTAAGQPIAEPALAGATVGAIESGVETPEESWEHYLADIHNHVGRLMRSAVGWSLLIGLWLIWADLLPAFTRLHEVVLWTRVTDAGVEEVALANLALAAIILVASIVLSMNIPGILEIAILQHLPLDTGARYATSRVVRYVLSVVGIVLAFNAVGIGWSTVQWLVAAITVGLGFGLQEIFANFVSGLIILFERPVRIGDFLTVGDTSGTVTRIQIRATTIRTPDRRELVIPNKAFVTGQIINWSLTSATVRLAIPVGVNYGSDTELVMQTLLEIARTHDRVHNDPPPEALFMGFGDNALEFELRTYVPSWECRLTIRHDLLMAIDKAFREKGLVIAFPQRDLHIKSMEGRELPIDVDQTRDGTPPPDDPSSPDLESNAPESRDRPDPARSKESPEEADRATAATERAPSTAPSSASAANASRANPARSDRREAPDPNGSESPPAIDETTTAPEQE